MRRFFPHLNIIIQMILKMQKKLLANEQYRLELGKKAGDYVAEYRAPGKVAERFLRSVNDDYSEEWLYDPKDIRYVNGWGFR